MIELTAFKPSHLHATPVGALFIPVTAGGGYFLAGRVSTSVDVLVELDGKAPCVVAETQEWHRPPGVVIEGGRIQVDLESGIPADLFHDLPAGAILIAPTGPLLVAKNARNENRAVQIAQSVDSPPSGVPAVAFTHWQYVTGQGDNLTVHYVGGAPATG